jgi:hypothetical protein
MIVAVSPPWVETGRNSGCFQDIFKIGNNGQKKRPRFAARPSKNQWLQGN